MNRLRFHLARGKHFMNWQLRYQLKSDDDVSFYIPKYFSAKLHNATLYNRRGVADKIYNGENKTVCSWISFDDIEIGAVKGDEFHLNHDEHFFDAKGFSRVYYNPRHLPHWTWYVNQGIVDKENLDGTKYDTIIVNNTSIYVKKK